MCRCLCWFLCFSVVFNFTHGKLPDEVSKCKMSDAVCLKEKAGYVLKKYHQGYSPLGLVSVDPLYFEKINVADSRDSEGKAISITLNFNQMNVFGIKDSTLETFKIRNSTDGKTFEVFFNIMIPRAQLVGNYEISGRMLLLPITGSGPSNVTLENLSIKAQLQGTYVIHNDKTYLYLKTFKTKLSTDRVHILLENLFNGNKLLGDSMNLMMNENWEELFNELNPSFVQSFGVLFVKAANGVFTKNPMYKLFLPE